MPSTTSDLDVALEIARAIMSDVEDAYHSGVSWPGDDRLRPLARALLALAEQCCECSGLSSGRSSFCRVHSCGVAATEEP